MWEFFIFSLISNCNYLISPSVGALRKFAADYLFRVSLNVLSLIRMGLPNHLIWRGVTFVSAVSYLMPQLHRNRASSLSGLKIPVQVRSTVFWKQPFIIIWVQHDHHHMWRVFQTGKVISKNIINGKVYYWNLWTQKMKLGQSYKTLI